VPLVPNRHSKYLWDTDRRRYVTRQGRVVDPARVRAEVDRAIDALAGRMGELCGRLEARSITIEQWQTGMREAMRELHVAAGASARGGWAQMTHADYGRIGQRMPDQYRYLRRFAQQLESGEQPMGARFARRAQMYAEAARGTHEAMRRQMEKDAGSAEEMRLLNALESCDECVLAAGYWAPIGTLPEIGSLTCLSNCKCTLAYR
jgi:hypothetical protein